MGFETQEEAERWAENTEFLAEQRREEKMFDPKESAWRELTKLPAYMDMPESSRLLQRAVFDYAWQAAKQVKK